MDWYIWITLGIILAIFEVIFMPGVFVLLFFGLSSCLVGLILTTGLPLTLPVQILLFIALAIILILLFRSKAKNFVGNRPSRMDFDSVEGGIATASEELLVGGYGKVDYRGSSWNAINVGSNTLKKGEGCSIVKIDGLQLSVKPLKE